jgi:hypothetical protein
MAKAKAPQVEVERLPLSETELRVFGARAAELARDIESYTETLKEKKTELDSIYSRIEPNFPDSDELRTVITTEKAVFTSKKEREYVVDADYRRKISNYLQSAGYEGEAHETEMARALGYFEEKHKTEVKIGLMASGRRLLEEETPLARAVQSVITVNTKVKFEVQAL